MRKPCGLTFLLALAAIAPVLVAQGTTDWKAPARAARKVNPIPFSRESIAAGKKNFQTLCFACHGTSGKGDGPAAVALKPRPRDLTDGSLLKQADGELYWKVRMGKAPMPSFAAALTKEQTWHLVNYVRSLGPKKPRSGASAIQTSVPAFKAPTGLRKAVSDVVSSYSALRQALVEGDRKAIAKRSTTMLRSVSRLCAADPKGLDAKARSEWIATSKQLLVTTKQLDGARKLDTIRKIFHETSTSVVRLVTKFGHGDARPLRVFHSDKALGGSGATWIQYETEPGNPYLGRQGRRNGRVTQSLGSGDPLED